MSKITRNVFIAAVAMLVFAVYHDEHFVAGGSGLVMLVGLIYAYVVTRRDEERAQAAEHEPAQ